MMVMIDHSKIGMKVLDIGIETMGFGKCREVSRVNKIANSMLAIMYDRFWSFYKDKQKVISLLINKLC